MLDKPISVRMSQGPQHRFTAELSIAQFEAIAQEFARLRDDHQWNEFLAHRRYERGDGSARPFVDPFSPLLHEIIGRYTAYHVALFWPVLDAMVEVADGSMP